MRLDRRLQIPNSLMRQPLAEARRPQILFLVHRIPYPPDRGDRIRSYHLLRYMSARADVHLATLADEPVTPETMAALRGCAREVCVARLDRFRWLRGAKNVLLGRPASEGLFQSRLLSNTVHRWRRHRRFDAIVVYCSSMFHYVRAPHNGNTHLIVDLVDVDSQKFFDYAATARGWKRCLFHREGTLLRRVEREVVERAAAVVLVSENEARLFRSICPNDRTFSVTNGVDFDYFKPVDGDGIPGRCVFVGALDYRANVDGVLWFCRHVWPRVRQARPDAAFAIVGRNPVAEIRELRHIDGVEVVGATPDVRPHLADASVAVAPLRIARGIQNKVLEAMAMRRAVLASTQALEGLNAAPGRHVVVAESPGQWVEETLKLMQDSQLRSTIGNAGRKYVESHHDWNTCLAPFSAILGAEVPDLNRDLATIEPADHAPCQMAPPLP